MEIWEIQKALEIAKDHTTVIIGEDTDLLVLALYHFNEQKWLYFTCESKKSKLPDVCKIGQAKQSLKGICDGLLLIQEI